jgi:molybdopterin converting factor small subunit
MHPQLAPMRRHLRVAVNQSMVSDDHGWPTADELAIIPPVAGGGDERLARVSWTDRRR